ncbi:MAG: DUF305 domain-containing protein [Gemmatimonadaceae bacterium]
MNTPRVLRISAALLLPLAFACKGKTDTASTDKTGDSAMAAMPGMASMSGMDAPVKIPPGVNWTAADVHFMQGMIAHHAQAIAMSKIAYKANASKKLTFFATKVDQSQRAEIVLMQGWLLDHGQTAPDTMSYQHVMMTGMLTPAEMSELEKTTGPDFDKKYLTYMIKHHQGAIQMVKDLFATPLSGQETNVNVFANDVDQVQTAEIAAMYQMLADL